MLEGVFKRPGNTPKLTLTAIILLFGVFLCSGALAVTVNLVDGNGVVVSGFRWTLQEDVTFQVDPDVFDPNPLSLNFHKSYIPVVSTGFEAGSSANITLPDLAKHYFVSVLPTSGTYTIGGAQIKPGDTVKTITVQQHPVPTAQISIFVFEDKNPINNAPDIPAEQGLAGWSIFLEDAGGRYGASAGQTIYDAFGNPLGTTYNPDGTVATMGNGSVLTDADGYAVLKNLYPAKYGVRCVPPPASPEWQQVTTIEGTPTVDAWVKAGEPSVVVEFGVPTTHIFMGFIQPFADATVLTGGSTVTGQIVNTHTPRPPQIDLTGAESYGYPEAWVGLNTSAGQGVYAARVTDVGGVTGQFEIPNVPPGLYQLVMWDVNLDMIISFATVTVPDPAPGTVDMGQIAVPSWFAHQYHYVFQDDNEDGYPNGTDIPLGNQNINLRWRDGTIYQAGATDTVTGLAPFTEIFPFFDWQVAEVDFARFKATGLTVVVDAGGPVAPVDIAPGIFDPVPDRLNPQPQPENGNQIFRTELGPVLTEGFQQFAGQTSLFYWGKTEYPVGENGGITGIVFYDVTRAENDPMFSVGEVWQPGIPRVQMSLYEDQNPTDGVIDDLDGDGLVTPADVDNYPFGWMDGGVKGPEDIDRNGNGTFDYGDAIQISRTDSWDDNLPTGCIPATGDPYGLGDKCLDGLPNWNQARPGVFDGGYGFFSYYMGGMANNLGPDGRVDPLLEIEGLPSSVTYIVQAHTPPGYTIVKEEDKNVDFGDEYVPAPGALPVPCVGPLHVVPAELTLFPGVPAEFAGDSRPLCNRKQVFLADQRNAATDFFMFTPAPIAAQYTGLINNDLGNTFNPSNVLFAEKAAVAYIPVAFRDYTGKEVVRIYSDQNGYYNGLVASTYTKNVPSPSGVAPGMYSVCINDPGPIEDPNNPGSFILDPHFRREFSQTCYTLQFMPGVTTYLDTPVIPVAAFAGRTDYPLDCEFLNGVPIIYSVSGAEGGPYVPGGSGQITIISQGPTTVPNPAFVAGGTEPSTIVRDYGFGATEGQVTLDGNPLPIVSWTADLIVANIPGGSGTGQIMVKRGDNNQSTKLGVTLHVGPVGGTVWHVSPSATPGATPIQDAIDLAASGDLILVAPGTYSEMVILYKDVKLQGSGAYSTVIEALNAPPEKIDAWKAKITDLLNASAFDLLPGQDTTFSPLTGAGLFTTELGPGVMVLATTSGFAAPPNNALIDGFTITGGSGGGVMVNGYANDLEVSNNKVIANSGPYGGGIRFGHPVTAVAFVTPVDAMNDNANIHHNQITQNGATSSGGGGVALYTGTDAYQVTDCNICGNFTTGAGAGIDHEGLSLNGTIARNEILFNQSFHQMVFKASGGGIAIQGYNPGGGALTDGSGSVTIDANLIKGNHGGAGDGGGIWLYSVNGTDVTNEPLNPGLWHTINIINNMVVDNVTGVAGAISMEDAAKVNIVNNTVARNDSTATAGEAFAGSPGFSNPQPAGVISRGHSPDLAAAITAAVGGGGTGPEYELFSNPLLVNNIIWQNRSFHWDSSINFDPVLGVPIGGLLPDTSVDPPVYDDLGVLGAPAGSFLNPDYCVLTDITGYDDGTNLAVDPDFVRPYFNGPAGTIDAILGEVLDPLQVAAALDEGGNFIDVRYGPLTSVGDYHLLSGSLATDAGDNAVLATAAGLISDYDGEARPNPDTSVADIGADELTGTVLACAGDLNGDGFVNADDLILFTGFGSLGGGGIADIDQDGDVDGMDLALLLSNYGQACP